MIDDECEAVSGMRIGREAEVLGENLPQRDFIHHKPNMNSSVLEPGPPRWDPGD
jgi:hypothetical protein